MTDPVRIAFIGFRLESNGHAPVVNEAEMQERGYWLGDEIRKDLQSDTPGIPAELSGFSARMDALRSWEMVPIAVVNLGAAGPLAQDAFEGFLDEVRTRLKVALPVHAVYFPEHGAGTATTDPDPDGSLFAMVRDIVGPDVPMVASLDLHANVSPKMVEAVDMLCSYLTNPHMDQFERGAESASAIHEMLNGQRTTKALVRLPLIPPSVSQNTKSGPYADHIAYGQSLVDHRVLNISLCSGFSLGDTVKNGMSVTVTTRDDQPLADRLALDIAARVWAERARYLVRLTPLDDAVRLMRGCNLNPRQPSLCFADVADNPGGGGRGNTVYILRAFLEAGASGVLVAPFFDRELAAEAHRLGAGANFIARFNRAETTRFSEPLSWPAQVEKLHDGVIVGRRGIRAGRRFELGPMALLRCDGVRVLVVSHRDQFSDPAIAEAVGISLHDLRALVVKSRGHFRAAVDEVFDDARIIEVDVPGLTTPMLERVPYRHVPRPIYPLDRDMAWSPA